MNAGRQFRINLEIYSIFIFVICFYINTVENSKMLDKEYSWRYNLSSVYEIELPSITHELQSKFSNVVSNICLTPTCIHTASQVLMNMDVSVNPCDNFYKFACGGYIKSTVIADDTKMIDNVMTIRNKIDDLLRASLEEESLLSEPKAIKRAKELYQICMNQNGIEEQGVKPLVKTLKNLGGWPVLEGSSWNDNDFDWIKSIIKFRDMGYSTDYFIKLNFSIDKKNSSRRILNVDQIFPPKKSAVSSGKSSQNVLLAYFNYMVNISVILGADKKYVKTELLELLKFEINLAHISLPPRNRSILPYNPLTIRKMNEKYPTIPWINFFNSLLINTTVDENELINVVHPDYIMNFEKLILSTPKRVQANYALWKVILKSVDYLPEKINEVPLKFTRPTTDEIPSARWKICLKTISTAFPRAVNFLYVKKYFDKNAKQEALDMVFYIRERFYKILGSADWMDDSTKKIAFDKANSIREYIGYPDNLLDDIELDKHYAGLNMTGDNYLEIVLKILSHQDHVYFSKLRHLYNDSNWLSTFAVHVNAYYSLSGNSIHFPAGILQGVFFDKDRPKYMNYGAIGSIIGHEITHGFAREGGMRDKNGHLMDWWSPTTAMNFFNKAQCIINQCNNFTSEEVGKTLIGDNVQRETIADIGGVRIAYLAYKDWEKSQNRPEFQLPGLTFTPRQMFWLSLANMRCAKYGRESLKHLIMYGTYAPPEYRLIGSIQNMPEFSDDFQCPVDSHMNPVNKCHVW